jgi:hypothetical protein
MAVDHVLNSPWTRKHDDPRVALIPGAPKTFYPKSLADLIEICRSRPANERLKAAGSHWALSRAAISDHTFIEIHDYRNARQAMGKTLHEVIPGCLDADLIERMKNEDFPRRHGTLIHVESGKRIYQLYAELDQVDPMTDPQTLAGYFKINYDLPLYQGPWAFETLGGAGGQTIVGAFNTGTHGGDFDRPPIADAVVAMHLVADGGKQYWIESVDDRYAPQLTDDDRLHALYGGPDVFEIIRDNDVFNAVLVSAGRFGVIYSVVLRAVPQYSLYERRRLYIWQTDGTVNGVKEHIKNLSSFLYKDAAVPAGATYVPTTPVVGEQRFLQIAICLTSHQNFKRNLAGVTKRWQLELPQLPAGRAERVGQVLNQPLVSARIQGPVFEFAGASFPYSPSANDPNKGGDISFLDRACSHAGFMRGVLEEAINDIEQFVVSNGATITAGVLAVAGPGGAGLLTLIPAFLFFLEILRGILSLFDEDDRLAEHMEGIKNALLDPSELDPAKRAAGVFIWQLIAYKIFSIMQENLDFEAISYAVMDRKNYLDKSCEINVDSVEVFFDAVDDRLIAFVDGLLAYETMQEFNGLAFVGYASLRFTGPSRALIGMQKHTPTCAVEVAGLRDVSGSQELVNYAVSLARNPNINGLLHWGQRNDYTRDEVEHRYGDSPAAPGGDLGTWRQALSRITDTGRLDGFSSDFTRKTGLEVV